MIHLLAIFDKKNIVDIFLFLVIIIITKIIIYLEFDKI